MQALLVLLLTLPAAAEVMDKEPTLSEIWLSALLASASSWIVGRFSPPLAFLVLVPALPVLGAVLECHDRFVGPAILREAGFAYFFQAHMALVLIPGMFLAGLSGRRRGALEPRTGFTRIRS